MLNTISFDRLGGLIEREGLRLNRKIGLRHIGGPAPWQKEADKPYSVVVIEQIGENSFIYIPGYGRNIAAATINAIRNVRTRTHKKMRPVLSADQLLETF